MTSTVEDNARSEAVMWTGVLVLVIVATFAGLAWFLGPAPRRSKHSRGGGGIQAGRDYNSY